jgi:hypothetical protein
LKIRNAAIYFSITWRKGEVPQEKERQKDKDRVINKAALIRHDDSEKYSKVLGAQQEVQL